MIPGFLLPVAAAAGWLAATGALAPHFEQVWRWGLLYAIHPATGSSAAASWAGAAGWLGFHAALVLGSAGAWSRERGPLRLRLLLWAGLSLLAAALSGRFAPRYFDQLLPALVIPAARGLALLSREPRRAAWALAVVALTVPALRFGPRYFMLAGENFRGVPHAWTNVALDQESRRAAEIINRLAHPGDTILVWGYRPNVVVYTRLPVASRLWDSQPLTGVPADRHLSEARSIAPELAAQNRRALGLAKPTFLVDGLSAYNPDLAIGRYPDLADWLRNYCVAGRTRGVTVYRFCSSP
jgi:hypothetical protein